MSRSNTIAVPGAPRTEPRRAPTHGGGCRAAGRSPLFVVFLDLVGFGIVIPLLPLYAERFGAGPVAVTWLVAVYSLMGISAPYLAGAVLSLLALATLAGRGGEG
ncbi:MAG TPA: hypothetical protein VHG28_02820 [Longimicrobiaceae bacterium]|nr:hypothetical protein [Longimicrobiaceae bacterium]